MSFPSTANILSPTWKKQQRRNFLIKQIIKQITKQIAWMLYSTRVSYRFIKSLGVLSVKLYLSVTQLGIKTEVQVIFIHQINPPS